MQDAYADIAGSAYDTAAQLGVEYYDAAGKTAIAKPAPSLPEEMLKASARWAMSTGDAVTGLELLLGSSERRTYGGLRNTVISSSKREKGARWARRARENACPFCRMMAIRGAVYHSAQTALGGTDRFHDHCHCLAVPVRPGQSYTLPEYTQQWEDEYKAARKAAGSGDPQDILRAWDDMISPDLAAGARKYTDDAYLKMTPAEQKKERARRRLADQKKAPVVKPKPSPEPTPKPSPSTKYDDEAYRRMSPEEKKRERARRRAALKKQGAVEAPLTPKEKIRGMPVEGRPMGMQKARDGANPADRAGHRHQDYLVNCQRVVMAYELRRRGYDVVALGNPNPAKTSFTNQAIRDMWEPVGNGHKTQGIARDVDTMTQKILEQPVGARGFISGSWKTGGAHIWNYEVQNVRNNKTGKVQKGVFWVEAQTDTYPTAGSSAVRNNYAARLDWTNPNNTPWFMRTDDLEPKWATMTRRKVFKE